jgi:FGFR1 oncogene partner
MSLVCEYFEWCELEHTLKVFLPELNQPRTYMRSDLEELLGLKDEAKLGDTESRPLLLSVVESYLKAEVSRQCCTLRRFLKGQVSSILMPLQHTHEKFEVNRTEFYEQYIYPHVSYHTS